MKKLLIVMLIGLTGTALIKNGQVNITPDNEVRVAGYPLPLPDAVKNSPVMGMVTTLLAAQLPPPPQPAAPQFAGAAARPGAPPARPVLPSVTSVAGTYNANTPAATAHAPAAGPNMAADQFNAVARALKGTQ